MGSFLGRRASAAGLAVVSALLLALGLAATACGNDDDTGAGIPQSGNPPTTPTTEAESDATPADIVAGRPYAVGQRTETLVDASRGTQAVPAQGIAEQQDRTIGLIVLYPAEGEPAAGTDTDVTPVADAPAAEGAFPLLVFAHGWTGTGASLVPNARVWASAGYVVALPTFPLSKEGIGFSDDLPQQPGDVRFVLDAVLGYGDDADDPLGGHVDGEHVAVGGHSLGSATAFAFLNSCCGDPRVDAVIGVSGGPLCCDDGEYPETIPVPLLLVHGGRDVTVPHAASDFVYETFGGEVDYLFLPEDDHVSFFRGERAELFDRTVVAFLDARLAGDPAALDALADEVNERNLGRFRR